MRKLVFTLAIFFASNCISQTLRFQIGGGFANYYGDLQEKQLTFQQAHGVIAIGTSYELTDRITVRSDLSYAKISGNDSYSQIIRNKRRNLNFTSNIGELSILGEYNFLNQYYTGWSPYIFTGLGIFYSNPYTYDVTGKKVMLAPLKTEGQGLHYFPNRKAHKPIQLNIPIGGGIKYSISDDITIAGEFGLRQTFTDYLDDVSALYVGENILLDAYGPRTVEMAYRGDELPHNTSDYPSNAERGNPKIKDYYYFGQVRIGFRLNWFDGLNKGIGCPSKAW